MPEPEAREGGRGVSTRVGCFAAAVILLGLVLAMPVHRARDHFICVHCASERARAEWRYGRYWPEASWGLSGFREEIRLSECFRDWIHDHDHAWVRAGRSGTYLPGLRWGSTESHGIAAAEWVLVYESDAVFREWLRTRAKEGSIGASEIRSAAHRPRRYSYGKPDSDPDNPGTAWLHRYRTAR